nr:methyltransferase [Heliothis virescens nudivirus]
MEPMECKPSTCIESGVGGVGGGEEFTTPTITTTAAINAVDSDSNLNLNPSNNNINATSPTNITTTTPSTTATTATTMATNDTPPTTATDAANATIHNSASASASASTSASSISASVSTSASVSASTNDCNSADELMSTLRQKLVRLKERVFKNCKSKLPTWNNTDETINMVRSQSCINRCFFKLAEMDQLSNFRLSNDAGLFMDLCAGPGGFTEYLTYKNWSNFGIVLQHRDLPVQIEKLPNPAAVKVYTVDLLNAHDRDRFRHDMGIVKVDLVVADGSIDCRGRENLQEPLNYDLIRAQVDVAFDHIKVGGNFVLKTFDAFTNQMLNLYYEIYSHFEEFTVVKPNTSRPANAERYIVAMNYKGAIKKSQHAPFYNNNHNNQHQKFESYKSFHYELVAKLAQRQISALHDLLKQTKNTPLFENGYMFMKNAKCTKTLFSVTPKLVDSLKCINTVDPDLLKCTRRVLADSKSDHIGFITTSNEPHKLRVKLAKDDGGRRHQYDYGASAFTGTGGGASFDAGIDGGRRGGGAVYNCVRNQNQLSLNQSLYKQQQQHHNQYPYSTKNNGHCSTGGNNNNNTANNNRGHRYANRRAKQFPHFYYYFNKSGARVTAVHVPINQLKNTHKVQCRVVHSMQVLSDYTVSFTLPPGVVMFALFNIDHKTKRLYNVRLLDLMQTYNANYSGDSLQVRKKIVKEFKYLYSIGQQDPNGNCDINQRETAGDANYHYNTNYNNTTTNNARESKFDTDVLLNGRGSFNMCTKYITVLDARGGDLVEDDLEFGSEINQQQEQQQQQPQPQHAPSGYIPVHSDTVETDPSGGGCTSSLPSLDIHPMPSSAKLHRASNVMCLDKSEEFVDCALIDDKPIVQYAQRKDSLFEAPMNLDTDDTIMDTMEEEVVESGGPSTGSSFTSTGTVATNVIYPSSVSAASTAKVNQSHLMYDWCDNDFSF